MILYDLKTATVATTATVYNVYVNAATLLTIFIHHTRMVVQIVYNIMVYVRREKQAHKT